MKSILLEMRTSGVDAQFQSLREIVYDVKTPILLRNAQELLKLCVLQNFFLGIDVPTGFCIST